MVDLHDSGLINLFHSAETSQKVRRGTKNFTAHSEIQGKRQLQVSASAFRAKSLSRNDSRPNLQLSCHLA